MVARMVRDHEAGGSNPLSPIFSPVINAFPFFIYNYKTTNLNKTEQILSIFNEDYVF